MARIGIKLVKTTGNASAATIVDVGDLTEITNANNTYYSSSRSDTIIIDSERGFVVEDLSIQLPANDIKFKTSKKYMSGSLVVIYNGAVMFPQSDYVEIDSETFQITSSTFYNEIGEEIAVNYYHKGE